MKKLILLTLSLLLTLGFAANAQTQGCISGNCQDGYGMYLTENGDRYTGFFENGDFNGAGTVLFDGGDRYTGNFLDGQFSGCGSYFWNNGSSFIGQWEQGLRQGFGTQYESDGSSQYNLYNDDAIVSEDSLDYYKDACINGDCNSGYGVYLFEDGALYEGEFIDGEIYGSGKYTLPDGSYYKGYFVNHNFQGYGVLVQPDNTKVEGLWDSGRYIGTEKNHYGTISGDCQNGTGIFVWEDGSRYEGSWKGGVKSGFGIYKGSDGSIIKGTWYNDNPHGSVEVDYPAEHAISSYIGEIDNGVLTGFGTFIMRDGLIYYGSFANNYLEGKVVGYNPSDNSKIVGIFHNGEYTGTACKESEVGIIYGNNPDGYGIRLTVDGRYYGMLKNGIADGEGYIDLYDGSKYSGSFKNGKMNGSGTLLKKDGSTLVGNFVNGKFTGNGVVFDENGNQTSGQFENGRLVSETTITNNVQKPEVSFTSPQLINTETESSTTLIKLCVSSKVPVSKVEITVNGILKVNKIARGFSVVNSQCDFSYEYEVELTPGQNEIRAIVTNEGGSTTSDARYITLKSSDNVSQQKRLALIIGNGSYQTVSALPNPPNDARSMEAALKQLGFETMAYTDLTQADMIRHIREFGTRLKELQAVGLFFYAGHGIQCNGENYLIPVNANIEKEQDVELESVNLNRVLGEMDYAKNDLNIIILDACRNNPFAGVRAIGNNGGLAQVNAPQGTFIAYATSPGKTASDGTGQNGLYTEQLVNQIAVPGLKLEDVFKRVRVEVSNKSNRQQIPWDCSSVFGDFYFKK